MSRSHVVDAFYFALVVTTGVCTVVLAKPGCTPSQRAVIHSVWDIAAPIVDCLLGSPYEDEDTAILACGVAEADKPYARSILGKKAGIKLAAKTEAVAKMGCAKDIKDAGAKR